MNYKELNDNELVYLCNENNEDAYDLVISKYKVYILKILKELVKQYNVIGIEKSDLYQEGLLGLFSAIKTYNQDRDSKFYTYAITCIKKNMIGAIKNTFLKKYRILNNSYSLDNILKDSDTNYYDIFKDETNEPNKVIIDKETENEMIEKLEKSLSKKELEIFKLKLLGIKNEEIAKLINKDKKYVENKLFRISKKYKEYFDKVNA